MKKRITAVLLTATLLTGMIRVVLADDVVSGRMADETVSASEWVLEKGDRAFAADGLIYVYPPEDDSHSLYCLNAEDHSTEDYFGYDKISDEFLSYEGKVYYLEENFSSGHSLCRYDPETEEKESLWYSEKNLSLAGISDEKIVLLCEEDAELGRYSLSYYDLSAENAVTWMTGPVAAAVCAGDVVYFQLMRDETVPASGQELTFAYYTKAGADTYTWYSAPSCLSLTADPKSGGVYAAFYEDSENGRPEAWSKIFFYRADFDQEKGELAWSSYGDMTNEKHHPRSEWIGMSGGNLYMRYYNDDIPEGTVFVITPELEGLELQDTKNRVDEYRFFCEPDTFYYLNEENELFASRGTEEGALILRFPKEAEVAGIADGEALYHHKNRLFYVKLPDYSEIPAQALQSDAENAPEISQDFGEAGDASRQEELKGEVMEICGSALEKMAIRPIVWKEILETEEIAAFAEKAKEEGLTAKFTVAPRRASGKENGSLSEGEEAEPSPPDGLSLEGEIQLDPKEASFRLDGAVLSGSERADFEVTYRDGTLYLEVPGVADRSISLLPILDFVRQGVSASSSEMLADLMEGSRIVKQEGITRLPNQEELPAPMTGYSIGISWEKVYEWGKEYFGPVLETAISLSGRDLSELGNPEEVLSGLSESFGKGPEVFLAVDEKGLSRIDIRLEEDPSSLSPEDASGDAVPAGEITRYGNREGSSPGRFADWDIMLVSGADALKESLGEKLYELQYGGSEDLEGYSVRGIQRISLTGNYPDTSFLSQSFWQHHNTDSGETETTFSFALDDASLYFSEEKAAHKENGKMQYRAYIDLAKRSQYSLYLTEEEAEADALILSLDLSYNLTPSLTGQLELKAGQQVSP